MARYGVATLFFCLLGLTQGLEEKPMKVISEEYDLSEGNTVDIQSVNYPNDADANLRQTWVLVAGPGSVVHLECDDLRLFQTSPCAEYAVELKDSSGVLHKCGVDYSYQFVSKGPRLEVTLRTGPWPRGFLKCSAKEAKPRTPGKKAPPKSFFFALQEANSTADRQPQNDQPPTESENTGTTNFRATTCPCGWEIKEKKTVLVRKEMRQTDLYPFMAGLVERGNKYILCGATILTEYHALTAAHCIERGIRYQLVIAGHEITRNESTDATFMIGVKSTIVHSGYVASLYRNDIALLVLERLIPYDGYTGPACLPTGRLRLDRHAVHIIDWGRGKVGKSSNPYLEKWRMRVIPSGPCRTAWPKYVGPASKQICVFPTKKSSCSGARGGPLVWLDPETNMFTLVGVASFGTSSCGRRRPLIATELTQYLTWIHRNIRESADTATTCTKA